jgi:hypothetical protein
LNFEFHPPPTHEAISVRFTAVFRRTAQGYFGLLEELPTIQAEGRTLEETRLHLEMTAILKLAGDRAQMQDMLEEQIFVREPLEVHLEFSPGETVLSDF